MHLQGYPRTPPIIPYDVASFVTSTVLDRHDVLLTYYVGNQQDNNNCSYKKNPTMQ